MLEYVLWGRPAGSTDALDDVVLTLTRDEGRIKTVQRLSAAEGWHSFHVQVLNGSRPDFVSGIA